MAVFHSADWLVPREKLLPAWAVIACDQFTSEPAYWQETARIAAGQPSALRLVFPETYLGQDDEARIAAINQAMTDALHTDVFRRCPDALIYVERTLQDGSIRQGLVGTVDLDAYDYAPDTDALIRATERTVQERIPPRVRIRQNAPLETGHVLLLCNDPEDRLLACAAARKDRLPRLYDFDLMQEGGHITGWLLSGADAAEMEEAIGRYEREAAEGCRAAGLAPILYAVGDGNHSLATAKVCWERIRAGLTPAEQAVHPARRAMVELENLYHPSQRFEPIHRLVKNVDPAALLRAAREICAEDGYPVPWAAGGDRGILTLNPALGELPVGILQGFLDRYLSEHPGTMDYIHGEESTLRLAEAPDTVAFLLPAIDKNSLFRGIARDGVLPRKTFSMGHAREKRYYLECRAIR